MAMPEHRRFQLLHDPGEVQPLIPQQKRNGGFVVYSTKARARAKEVSKVQEACYCGRSGDIRDRKPVRDSDGRRTLECPDCGHTDYLEWLPEDTGYALWEEAHRRREELAYEEHPAA